MDSNNIFENLNMFDLAKAGVAVGAGVALGSALVNLGSYMIGSAASAVGGMLSAPPQPQQQNQQQQQ